jgi:hypothetical protein
LTKSIDLIPTWYWPDGIPRYLSPPRSSVYATTVDRWARRRPDDVALRGSTDVSYEELNGLVRAVSSRLRQMLPAADNGGGSMRMAIVTEKKVSSAIAMLGALHAGADTLLLDSSTPEDEVRAALTSFRCGLLVADDRYVSAGWETISSEALSAPLERGTVEGAESRSGRWAFPWDGSFALQPNAVLLGWALAFRAFAALGTGDLFIVSRGLYTWEGVVGLLSPLTVGDTCWLPTPSDDTIRSAGLPLVGAWLDWAEAEAILETPDLARSVGVFEWVFVSVDSPIPVRKRRRLGRVLQTQVLTVFGTPGTGPIAASPRKWSIDEAVGTPVTGVDVLPLDERQQPAEPPWHLLTGARIGVKSSYFVPGMEIEGPAAARILEDGAIDTMAYGRMDANGLLYLL